MPNPPASFNNADDLLLGLDGFLGETSSLLQTLIDLERRDELAPERLLRATDGAIAGLEAWRDTLKLLAGNSADGADAG
jgi:hypothetical protein